MKSLMRSALLGGAGLAVLSLSAHAAGSTAVTDTSLFNSMMTTMSTQLAQRPENPGGAAGFRNENPGGGGAFRNENPGGGGAFRNENPGGGGAFRDENPGGGGAYKQEKKVKLKKENAK
jgi:hypothetical protein